MNFPPGARGKSAFSLIEVTIAIGIVGFALLAVLGAISTGSNIQRQAINATVQAQIMQSVLGSLRQSDWTGLPGWDGTNLFFDERGVVLSNAANAIYTATPTVITSVSLPGAVANTNMARVNVQISKNTTNDSVTVSAIIANNGQ